MRTKNSFPKYSFFLFICNNFKQYSYLFSQRIFFVSLQESNNLLIFLVNCRFHTTNHTTFLFFTILILHNNKFFQHLEIILSFLFFCHFSFQRTFPSNSLQSILFFHNNFLHPPSLSLLFTKMLLLF